jgi:LPS export ABC transporter protein LptC
MRTLLGPGTSVLVATLLVGATISGIVLIRSRPVTSEAATATNLGVAYYLKKAELTGMGKDGKVLYRVTADEAAQRLDDESIGLTDVHLIYDPASDIPWDMVADTGRIPSGGNIIHLEGRVLAVSREGDESATTIRTNYLEVDPDRRTANTEARVVIEFDEQRVNATGLQADLERNKFKLLSNVNGKFFP